MNHHFQSSYRYMGGLHFIGLFHDQPTYLLVLSERMMYFKELMAYMFSFAKDWILTITHCIFKKHELKRPFPRALSRKGTKTKKFELGASTIWFSSQRTTYIQRATRVKKLHLFLNGEGAICKHLPKNTKGKDYTLYLGLYTYNF